MAAPQFDSGRQFDIDATTGQIFFREPVNPGMFSNWMALPPSDFHAPRLPGSHNVGVFVCALFPC